MREKLREAYVILDPAEREGDHPRSGAQKLAAKQELALIEDEALLAENAGLTEWPVALMGTSTRASSTCRPRCSPPR